MKARSVQPRRHVEGECGEQGNEPGLGYTLLRYVHPSGLLLPLDVGGAAMSKNVLRDVGGIVAAFVVWWAAAVLLGILR